MRYADDDSLTGLDTARRGRLPRGRRRWTGSLGQRARASRGLPQAVFKITSYNRSGRAVWDRVHYMTREGALEAEGPNGERLDQGALAQLVDEWSEEAEARGRRQYTMSAVVSFPAAVDQEKATEAARAFFHDAFADNHDYVFAAHSDTKQFHVHVVVQSAGHDGKQLRIRRDDLQDLRLLVAEKAQEQGIALDASPRWARGLDAERRPGRQVEGMMRRWRSPEAALEGAWVLSQPRRTQLDALAAERHARGTADEPTVTALEYARAAERVAGQVEGLETHTEKVETMKAAVELARLGLTLAASEEPGGVLAAEGTVVRAAAAEVRKIITARISDLAEDPAAQRAAIQICRPLEAHLGADRPAALRRWARDAERPRPGACQALEYARGAGGVAGQLHTLTNDADRVAAVKGAVSLARFGWDLAHKDKGSTEDRELARDIIDQAERVLRFGIERIEDPQAKREAIQARQTLYMAGVKEYRAARREQERQRRQEAEREEGPERER